MRTTLKHARMELKTTEDMKDLIFRAAALMGIDVTAFVLGPAAERAQQVIANYSAIQLGIDGQRRFAALMNQPPEPTQAMNALGELPDFEEIR
ncbi:type II toxin-antitoxin system TacA family antitoxin [Methylobacter tundripaludum]|uniref:type II toxin-antitoxin system TacA family antitoxin n=1 Tax=Methylobacter tundripaludum TaxID=173365 RepID=UPI00055BE5F0|nr:DUF1778 domain-containing protein [Methylobacter tundripaludum]